jgi:aryl-alcohol dehydrogenase-like predicted oxidoreductase
VAHLEENVAAAAIELTADELEKLDAIAPPES